MSSVPCVCCLTSGPAHRLLPGIHFFSPTPLHSTMLSWISSLQKTVREPPDGEYSRLPNAVLLTHAPPQHCLPVPTSLQGPCKSRLSLVPSELHCTGAGHTLKHSRMYLLLKWSLQKFFIRKADKIFISEKFIFKQSWKGFEWLKSISTLSLISQKFEVCDVNFRL